jgi:class 3 adenylate cyclase
MSNATAVRTTVMFADICDSTLLFSRLGDDRAFALINDALKEAAAIVERHDGRVLRTKGDDILCIFSDASNALSASMAIHAVFDAHRPLDLAMSIGINSGPALLSEGDILGDTVNIAARLADFAKAGQTLVSSATIEILSRASTSLIRPFGEITLKGKQEPVSTYEVLGESDPDEITQAGPTPLVFPRASRISLRFQNREFQLDYLLTRFRLGRSPDCELILNHPLVSRQHAEIAYRDNEFVLRDFSTNGTELIVGGRSIHLHHKLAALRGSGSIFLGRTTYNRKFEITFHAGGGTRAF